MSEREKRDLLIHFDEDKNEVVFYTISESKASAVRAGEFDGARVDIPHYKEMTPDDAERTLGSTVFSLIDTFSKRKTGIRDYETLNKERHQQDVAAWEMEAASGSAEAQYMLSIEYHSRALFNSDRKALEKAEEMLNLAAAAGYPDAVSSLENNWPIVRAAVERKIARGAAAQQGAQADGPASGGSAA